MKDANDVRRAGLPLHPRGEPIDLDAYLGAHAAAAPPIDGAPMPEPDELVEIDRIGPKLPAGALAPGDPDWSLLLKRTQRNQIRKSLGNLTVILQHDARWRGVLGTDERTGDVQLLAPPPFVELAGLRTDTYPRQVQDADEVWCCRWLEMEYGIDWPTTKIHDALDAVAQRHAFDPVRDHLEGLVWDGTARVDSWLPRLLGAQDTPLHRAIGARWLISAVARTFRPGCKADHVLVLEAAQGRGKSTALAILAGRDEWFCDRLPDVRKGKDAAEVLQGPWIVEIAELDAIGKAEAATIKAFLTSPSDRYRPPYGRRPVTRPRRCVFAASTNETAYLKDATGGRRFWPARVGEAGPIDLEGLRAERDQLWAEALHRFRAGEPWHLVEEDLVTAAQEAQEERYQGDEWEDLVARLLRLEQRRARGSEPQIPVSQALTWVGLTKDRWGRAEQMRMTKILTRCGWVRRRRRQTDGSTPWVYVPDEDPQGLGSRLGSEGSEVGIGGEVGIMPPDGDPNLDPNLGDQQLGLGSASEPGEHRVDPNDPNDPNLERRGTEVRQGEGGSGERTRDPRALRSQMGSLGSPGSGRSDELDDSYPWDDDPADFRDDDL